MKITRVGFFVVTILFLSCQSSSKMKDKSVSLITVDPGHFHAALVQKKMYEDVDFTVYVYAPEGPEVKQYLTQIEAYNKAAENPTHWKEEVVLGDDFFERMLREKR